MKTLILSVAALAALAGATVARADVTGQLSGPDAFEIRLLVPDARLDHLSPQQVAALEAALHSGDGNAAQLRAALN